MSLNLAEIRERLEELRSVAESEILDLYGKLENEELGVDEWQSSMESLIETFSYASYMLGSDESELSFEKERQVGQHVTDQSQYLRQFAGAITLGLSGAALAGLADSLATDHLRWGAWRGRALAYTGALTRLFWEGVQDSYGIEIPEGEVPDDGFSWVEPDLFKRLPLPALPGDGSTLCTQWCKCEWDINVLDSKGGNFDCYWILDKEAENCQTCQERAIRWSPLKVRDWEIIADDVIVARDKEFFRNIISRKLAEVIAQKGGKGSGNWGHGGLAGVHGGSSPKSKWSNFQPIIEYNRIAEEEIEDGLVYALGESKKAIRLKSAPRGYLTGLPYMISPEGDILVANEDVEAATHTLLLGGLVLTEPSIAESVGKRGRELAVDVIAYGMGEDTELEEIFYNLGYFSIRRAPVWNPSGVEITFAGEFNKALISKVKKLISDDKIVMDGIKQINLERAGLDELGNFRHTSIKINTDDLYMVAGFRRAYGGYLEPVYKEKTEKGGKGSGHHGHGGLAGVHGGSSPTKTSGGQDQASRVGKFVEVDARFPGLDKVDAKSSPTEEVAKRSVKIRLSKGGETITGKSDDLYYRNGLFYGELTEDDLMKLSYYQGSLDIVKERTGLDLTKDVTFIPASSDEEYAMAQIMTYANAHSPVQKNAMDLGKGKLDDLVSNMGGELACAISISKEQGDTVDYRRTHIIAKNINKDGFFVKEQTYRVFAEDEYQGLRHETIKVPAHQILTHELGHVVWNQWKGKTQKWERLWKENKRFDRHTGYSTTSAEEGFAETFVSYIYNIAGTQYRETLDWSSRVMDEIIKDIVNGSVTEKGGKGSGNWGHSGLAGIHGGSSPTKTGHEPSVDLRRQPGLSELPLMKAEVSDKLKGMTRWSSYVPMRHFEINSRLSMSHIEQLKVVQAVANLVEEKTGINPIDAMKVVNFVRSAEEMALAPSTDTGGITRVEPDDFGWTTLSEIASSAQDNTFGQVVDGEKLYLREFGDDNIIRLGGSHIRAEHAIAHEFGHVIFRKVMTSMVVRTKTGHWDKKGNAIWQEGFASEAWRKRWESNPEFDRHTDYSFASFEEAFCETFVSSIFNVKPAENLDRYPEAIHFIGGIFWQIKDTLKERNE